MRLVRIQKSADLIHKGLSLLGPRMFQVNLLPFSSDIKNLAGMGVRILNLLCQVVGTSRLEEQERLFAEVVQNAGRGRCDDWLPQSKILKNAGRGVDFCKGVPMIWDHADITRVDCSHKVFQPLRTEIAYEVLKVVVTNLSHHALKKMRLRAKNVELNSRDGLSHSFERVDSDLQTIPFNQRAVIHDHEALVSRFAREIVLPGHAERKNLAVRRVHDHRNLFRTAAAGGENALASDIDSDHQICPRNAPFLKALQQLNTLAARRGVENRGHELRHRVVQIENHLGPEHLGDERTQDKDVGHIMHIDQIVAAGE